MHCIIDIFSLLLKIGKQQAFICLKVQLQLKNDTNKTLTFTEYYENFYNSNMDCFQQCAFAIYLQVATHQAPVHTQRKLLYSKPIVCNAWKLADLHSLSSPISTRFNE